MLNGMFSGGYKALSIEYPKLFNELHEQTRINEGGLNADDGGHKSYAGVWQPTWNAYIEKLKKEGHDIKGYPKDVEDLEGKDDLIKNFYYWWSWERPGAPDLAHWPWLLELYLDWYTMSGAYALKALQRQAGMDASDCDGAWGPKTREAVVAWLYSVSEELKTNPNADNDVLRAYYEAWVSFIKSLKHKDESGILARCDRMYQRVLAQVECDNPVNFERIIDAAELAEIEAATEGAEKPTVRLTIELEADDAVIGHLEEIATVLRAKGFNVQ